MCGRYTLDEKTYKEVLKLINQIDKNINNFGEIFPGTFAPIIHSNSNNLDLSEKFWGYPHFKNKGLIINAKQETVLEKSMFASGIMENRIIIPATSFFEWNVNKEKNTLFRKDGKKMYMAGFFDTFDGEDRFVIITTEANDSMKKIHNRMPLILEENQVEDWILNPNYLEKFLRQTPSTLEAEFETQQQTMF